jgi:hypothetical protein
MQKRRSDGKSAESIAFLRKICYNKLSERLIDFVPRLPLIPDSNFDSNLLVEHREMFDFI